MEENRCGKDTADTTGQLGDHPAEAAGAGGRAGVRLSGEFGAEDRGADDRRAACPAAEPGAADRQAKHPSEAAGATDRFGEYAAEKPATADRTAGGAEEIGCAAGEVVVRAAADEELAGGDAAEALSGGAEPCGEAPGVLPHAAEGMPALRAGCYDLLSDGVGHVLLVVDAGEDEPAHPRLVWDGSDRMLFYRSLRSACTIDGLAAAAREALAEASEVTVAEVGGEEVVREYSAPLRRVRSLETLAGGACGSGAGCGPDRTETEA